MDRIKVFTDSRDLCDDLVDNGYQPSYGGWYDNGEVRVGFHDDTFQHIDVEHEGYTEYDLPISEVFYNEKSECYATENIKLF